MLNYALWAQDLVEVPSSSTRGVRHGCSDTHGVDRMARRLNHLLLNQLLLLFEIADHPIDLDRVLPLFLNLMVYVSNVCTVKTPFPFCWVLKDYCHPPWLVSHCLFKFLDRWRLFMILLYHTQFFMVWLEWIDLYVERLIECCHWGLWQVQEGFL